MVKQSKKCAEVLLAISFLFFSVTNVFAQGKYSRWVWQIPGGDLWVNDDRWSNGNPNGIDNEADVSVLLPLIQNIHYTFTVNGPGTLGALSQGNYKGRTTIYGDTLTMQTSIGNARIYLKDSAFETPYAGLGLDLEMSGGLNLANDLEFYSGSDFGTGLHSENRWSTTIFGQGGLLLNGTGELRLMSNNSYAGQTIVEQGTLRLGSFDGITGSLGTGTVEVKANGTLRFDRTNTYELANHVSGIGLMSHDGSGMTVLTANSNFSGRTNVANGILQIGNGAGTGLLGTGDIVIESPGTLQLHRSNSYTLHNTISGAGTINKLGLGTAAFSQDNTFTGLTTITQGTVRLGNNTASGSLGTGNVDIASGAKFEFRRSDDFIVANQIIGDGSIIKNGAGATILTANSSYSGSTIVNSGILRVASGASVDSSANANSGLIVSAGEAVIENGATFTLGSSGTANIGGIGSLVVNGVLTSPTIHAADSSSLSGTGTLAGQLQVDTGASLQPGNSIGVLEIDGDLNLNGTYEWEFDSAQSDADILIVQGDVNLSGAQLDPIRLDGIQIGQVFTVLAYSGILTGQFANEGALGNWSINYGELNPGVNGSGGQTGLSYITVSAVPEPSSLLLFGATILVFPFWRRRRFPRSA
ncbi:MAG: autotransporter-associated beta strand repeat-containing protein [Pirellulaceae bacterium]